MADRVGQIVPASSLNSSHGSRADRWSFRELVGQLIELSEEVPFGALTFASELIAAAQRAGEPVGWISARPSIFYPPDLAENGIEVAAINVVVLPGEREAIWACDLLLRSGAFGLVIVDIASGRRLTDSATARLIHLARRQRTAVLFLTSGGQSRPSSLIPLRGLVRRRSPSAHEGERLLPELLCEVTTVKDKRGAEGLRLVRRYNGPVGVC